MIEEDKPHIDDNPPHYGAPDASRVASIGSMAMDQVFKWHSELVDQAIENTVRMAGYNTTFMKYFLGMNPWFRSWQKQVDDMFRNWELQSPAGFGYDISKTMVEQQIQFIPPILREWVKYKLMFCEQLHGKDATQMLEDMGNMMPGGGELYSDHLNHHFLTEYSDGWIGPVDIEQIDELFSRDKGQKAFPHIILTSSHAKGETLSDVTDITHGIQALARDSIGKGVDGLDIIHVNGSISHDPNSTLILFACDVEKNPFLNGAALLRRLADLKHIEQHPGQVDDFANASPGAKRIAKLILRCMAQDPTQVDVNDPRPLHEIGGTIQLRARPELIAQHFQLIGYSKGGNVVSDAMRYLVSELTAKDAKGHYIVRMNGEGPRQENIRDLVRNIACMSIAALEVPMEEHYKTHGVRRVSFNNKFDMISNHSGFESTWADHKWTINGKEERNGHDPKDALGAVGKRGYVLDDKRVRRRVSEAMAPLFGKAAISSISFTDDLSRVEGNIIIGTAAGTSDESFTKHIPHIEETLKKNGFNGKILPPEQNNRRAFVLKGPDGWRENPKALDALFKAFKMLRDEKGSNLVIADDIFERILPERVQHMASKPGASHAWKSFSLDVAKGRGAA